MKLLEPEMSQEEISESSTHGSNIPTTPMSDYEDAIEVFEEGSLGLGNEGLRHRKDPLWDPDRNADSLSLSSEIPGFHEVKELLERDDTSELAEEEINTGCPLPSTPVDPSLLETEIVIFIYLPESYRRWLNCKRVFNYQNNLFLKTEYLYLQVWIIKVTEALKAGVLENEIDLGTLAHTAAEQAEEFVRKVWEASWSVCHFRNLPRWLQDNDYLHAGHRPPLPSFSACFRSIFRIHSETGNIWTHLLGCVAFIGVAIYFLTRPSEEVKLQEKLVFAAYFAGAIVCLGLSFAFHTVHCHSENVGKIFSKLDYCGIALLITGSFVPWLYYGFYCHFQSKLIYLSAVITLGISAMVVSLWDRFSEPSLRPLRAAVFTVFGLSGVVPAVHYALAEGWLNAISQASLGWLVLMGCLYIIGAMFYALRVPERFFPGKCDIWFQSHQIFHVLVIAAAFVHYHGITEMAMYRMSVGECSPQEITF